MNPTEKPPLVNTEVPLKDQRPRVPRKPRTKHDPVFTSEAQRGPVPAELVAKKSKKELRPIADEYGYNRLVLSYVSAVEGRKWLTRDYPFEMKGYHVPTVIVNDEAELIAHIALRYAKWYELEADRGPKRDALHAEARADAGVTEEVAPGHEFIAARLANVKLLVPVTDRPRRVERFVDIDGNGGRRWVLAFVEKDDLTKSGKPRAKAKLVLLSPHTWRLVKDDEALSSKFEVPEGYPKPVPVATTPPKPKGPPKPRKPRMPQVGKLTTKDAASKDRISAPDAVAAAAAKVEKAAKPKGSRKSLFPKAKADEKTRRAEAAAARADMVEVPDL